MTGTAQRAPRLSAAPVLTIDRAALVENYRRAQRLSGDAEAGAVVKADAYGLGIETAARALSGAGCRTFFTAHAEGGARLGVLAPQARIYVLNGLLPGSAEACRAHDLRPCLCSLDQLEAWQAEARRAGRSLPAALHVETGINRLGLSPAALRRIAEEPPRLDGIQVELIMSHLACADAPDDPMNALQLERFRASLALLKPLAGRARASLSNTAGLGLGEAFRFDLTRPGIGLYGGNPSPGGADFAPVVSLTSFIAQIRRVAAGEKVGYGGAFTAPAAMKIAIVPAGYADGVPRALWGAQPGGGAAAIGGLRAAIIGRVSMDMLMLDVSALPGDVARPDAPVELLGRHITLDDWARAAGTIPHEIAIGLGRCARKELRAGREPQAA